MTKVQGARLQPMIGHSWNSRLKLYFGFAGFVSPCLPSEMARMCRRLQPPCVWQASLWLAIRVPDQPLSLVSALGVTAGGCSVPASENCCWVSNHTDTYQFYHLPQVVTEFGRSNWKRIIAGVADEHPGQTVGVFVCGPPP